MVLKARQDLLSALSNLDGISLAPEGCLKIVTDLQILFA